MSIAQFYKCEATDSDIAVLCRAWGWRIPEFRSVVVVSAFGDVFFRDEQGQVYWLNTGTAEVALAATSIDEFWEKARQESGANWFMPKLVVALASAGKERRTGQCYTYAVLPIFAEGKYEIWNFTAVDLREHFQLTGEVHKEIFGLPEGAHVKVVVGP